MIAGGNANNSANTGAFNMNANNSSGNANHNIGSQLSLCKGGVCDAKTLALAKTQGKTSMVLVGNPKAPR